MSLAAAGEIVGPEEAGVGKEAVLSAEKEERQTKMVMAM